MSAKHVHFKLKKSKILLRTIGAILFVALCIWILQIAVTEESTFFLVFYAAISLLGILFFGFAAFLGVKSFYGDASGLTISSVGIEDNTASSSVGLIKWEDIESFSELNVKNQMFLVVILKNPNDYIVKIKSAWQRKLMKLNSDWYGSPVCIGAQILDCDFDFFKKTVLEEFEAYKQRRLR